MFKRILYIIAFIILITTNRIYAVSAESYCVMEADTKLVLLEKNMQKRLGPASVTKIMTAICVIENSDISNSAFADFESERTEGSSLYLKSGEEMKAEDLLYGLMLNSGNDAAVILAKYVSGSVDEFVNLMNETAIKIGAQNTHFANPNGLYNEDHYTTAYDLALISSYAMKNETFRKIVSTKSYSVTTVNTNRKIFLKNHNKLLSALDGCIGIKTGFTKKTGRTLASAINYDGTDIICITLNAPDDWNDHKSLYNECKSKFSFKKSHTSEGIADSVLNRESEKDTFLDLLLLIIKSIAV